MSSTITAVHQQLLFHGIVKEKCQVTTGDKEAYTVVAGANKGRENVGGVRRKGWSQQVLSRMSIGTVSDSLPKDDMRSQSSKDTQVRVALGKSTLIVCTLHTCFTTSWKKTSVSTDIRERDKTSEKMRVPMR